MVLYDNTTDLIISEIYGAKVALTLNGKDPITVRIEY